MILITVESFITVITIVVSIIGSYFVLRTNWKQYSILYLISSFTAYIMCYLFVSLGLYVFPFRFFPSYTQLPILLIFTVAPFVVIISVKHSPKSWAWKIPFYWAIVHIVTFIEIMLFNYTQIIKYTDYWDMWDTYSGYWIFFLLFEYIGGMIVISHYRKPLDITNLHYGRLGWIIIHFVLISTIFIAGVYAGWNIGKN